MNHKQKIHTARFKDLNSEQEKFINARITTPQTYDEIKGKGTATILKIASQGIVEKLLKRCEMYKGIINKKTETIKSKNELITLLAARLQTHEPELFTNDFKDKAEAVELAKNEEVKSDLDNKEELSEEEKKELEKANQEAKKEQEEDPWTEEDRKEQDPNREDPEDIDDEPTGPECGEGWDGPDIDDDPDEDKENEK